MCRIQCKPEGVSQCSISILTRRSTCDCSVFISEMSERQGTYCSIISGGAEKEVAVGGSGHPGILTIDRQPGVAVFQFLQQLLDFPAGFNQLQPEGCQWTVTLFQSFQEHRYSALLQCVLAQVQSLQLPVAGKSRGKILATERRNGTATEPVEKENRCQISGPTSPYAEPACSQPHSDLLETWSEEMG